MRAIATSLAASPAAAQEGAGGEGTWAKGSRYALALLLALVGVLAWQAATFFL